MGHEILYPNPWMALPFGVLLVAIALLPPVFPTWWTKHYANVAFGLGAIALAYYLFGLHAYARVARTAHEYFSFIVLIGSLFVVSGGIHINVKGEATPRVNTLFLLVGALSANLLGTTGAAMLFIRPWIRMNKYRITAHHIIFFIFIIANVGGCLTPIGDPPLFLGYLKGIPFWWITRHCWPMWAVGVGFLLAVFYVLDALNYHRAPKAVRREIAEPPDQWCFNGRWNLAYLLIVLGAVFVHRPLFLREALMALAATASYISTRKEIHEANHFNFHPIQEVAILFAGIFATMMPALDWLEANAGKFAQPNPAFFYWCSGSLSSCLDNAPTYLSFLSAAIGLFVDPRLLEQVQALILNPNPNLAALSGPGAEQMRHTYEALQRFHGPELAAGLIGPQEIQVAFLLGNPEFNLMVIAVSVGAVFFGAATYIGNGPNFMVKSIADHQKVHLPGFLRYILCYTLPYLAPMLLLVWFLFFRR